MPRIVDVKGLSFKPRRSVPLHGSQFAGIPADMNRWSPRVRGARQRPTLPMRHPHRMLSYRMLFIESISISTVMET